MEVSALNRLKELEEENRRLKQSHTELSLENRVLKEIVEKAIEPDERRELRGDRQLSHQALFRW